MFLSAAEKIYAVLFCAVFLSVLTAAPGNRSQYYNNEKHHAEKLDENDVPIDPACRFRTLWKNVRISGVTRAGIPNVTLEKITVVKFHWAGAWIAWTDKNGYHEPTKDDYVPWKNFPAEISDYYAKYCVPEWKREVRVSLPFSLRTPQYGRNGKRLVKKYGNLIKRRGTTGLLCPQISNNVYVPFSEFPPKIRELVGFWENESYVPDMPVLEKTPSSIDDEVLFITASELRTIRTYFGGILAKVTFFDGQKTVQREIFIQRKGNKKGKLTPNHKSDLHVFTEGQFERVCTKCELSDHNSEKYFNYMFDRQIRNACPVLHSEYALIKKGTKKIGRKVVNNYILESNYDKTHPADSKRLRDEAAAIAGSGTI